MKKLFSLALMGVLLAGGMLAGSAQAHNGYDRYGFRKPPAWSNSRVVVVRPHDRYRDRYRFVKPNVHRWHPGDRYRNKFQAYNAPYRDRWYRR
jgi:Ni/Co efflux regulator RcnB